ncbi:type I restriction enzyme HsdR N-terminal domain-containing protein [Sphingobacterium multivorum]|uniref:type I restriction enzyme HsdR N-terminal domain-containing protein n=1 Tax=Sphingobacterium multivorum TaxID=28454 RepID=UPI00345E5565
MFSPTPLNLPPYQAKISKKNNAIYIFDELRKKDLVLTPEEWVRQHWINYLSLMKNYPKALMHIEGGLKLNNLQKRSDLLIYNSSGHKVVLAEFKAPHIKITQQVFEQIANYNTVHRIPYLLVSNGMNHYYCKIDFIKKSYEFLEDLPSYNEID